MSLVDLDHFEQARMAEGQVVEPVAPIAEQSENGNEATEASNDAAPSAPQHPPRLPRHLRTRGAGGATQTLLAPFFLPEAHTCGTLLDEKAAFYISLALMGVPWMVVTPRTESVFQIQIYMMLRELFDYAVNDTAWASPISPPIAAVLPWTAALVEQDFNLEILLAAKEHHLEKLNFTLGKRNKLTTSIEEYKAKQAAAPADN
ncbi:uncharacterized protein EV422DRAFT_510462 [Fimicolochytrium jonesii]|uniref:uncharacterized protein n=1 Tax=Fimicolochytrium jonesii TaxID=1396493 RepID=UPI0022FEAEFC|nr:uncharacterized protein EV422DRAFT_510462 [Fimicolochytrium jonesii]KAI8815565.1 hypothetical protein EV422DRAFT_510462 [Fimicolochytrium jonesii]